MDDDAENTLTPRLRFPEFQDPWETASLADVADLVNEKTPIAKVAVADYVSTENLLPDFDGVTKASKLPPTGAVTRYQPGDVLMSNIRPYLKKIWQADRDGGASNDVIVVRARESISRKYLSIILKNDAFITYVMGSAKGLKMPRGDVEAMREYAVPYPSPSEQQKIADCLTSLDEVIVAQGRNIEALKAHKKGLMQQLFPREGETRPRLRFPEFRDAGEWEEQTLGATVHILKGKGVAKTDVVEGGTTRCIRYAELYTVYGEVIVDVISRTNVPLDHLVFSEPGDVIIPASGETKEDIATCACVIDGGVALGSDLNVLRSDMDGRFLSYYLNGVKRAELAKVAQGHTVAHLYPSQISQLSITVPWSDAEQRRIADCLSSLDARIAAEGEKLAALKTHKKGLMQQLFPSATAGEGRATEGFIMRYGHRRITAADADTAGSNEPAAVPSRKPYTIGFARQLLAAEILHHCYAQPTMGRVKLQKLIHLCEYHAELDDIHGSYARAAAGPFDNKMMRGVASGLEKQKWFKQVREEKRTSYEPMQSSGQHSKYLQRWSAQLPKIHEIIKRFATAKTYKCEIVSTLYAAWNDLLIDGRHASDEEIIREASDPKRWHESKADIDKSKWPTALKWMREKGITPRGYGAHTTR